MLLSAGCPTALRFTMENRAFVVGLISSEEFILLLLLLHLFNGLFSRTTWVSQYQKGKTSMDLNEARDDGVLGWQWHRLHHMQTICTSLGTDNRTSTSLLNFYRPDALPDTQPTVSKHSRIIALKD